MVKPKDKSDPKDQCGLLYEIGCDDKYVGETGRTLKTRVEEHQKPISDSEKYVQGTAVQEHMCAKEHQFSWDQVSIIKREDNKLRRKIKEGIEIHKRNPVMNRDPGIPPPLLYAHLLSRDRPRSRASVY